MNRLYIANLPNGTISIVSASSRKDLFFKLDSEGDPVDAKITQVDFNEDIHVTTAFVTDPVSRKPAIDADGAPELDWSVGEYALDAKTRKVVFKA